jgi:hypothetical protein
VPQQSRALSASKPQPVHGDTEPLPTLVFASADYTTSSRSLLPIGTDGHVHHSPLSKIDASLVRCFTVRSRIQEHRSTTLPLLIRMLSSYPRMLGKGKNPPFVHKTQLDSYSFICPASVAILNCQAILRMFFTSSDRSAAWKLIRLEHERIWFSYEAFQDWELLGAFQSLLVYSILRLAEEPSRDNDFDFPLLISINNIGKELVTRVAGVHLFDFDMPFDHWIFVEARKRTMLIFGILNLMVHISDAVICTKPTQFAIMTLSAPAAMWDAVDSNEWCPIHDDAVRERTTYALSFAGRLMKLLPGQHRGYCAFEAEWEDWLAEQGEIGGLMAAVAILLS